MDHLPIMRAEGPKKLSAGTSRKSRPEGGVAASYANIRLKIMSESHYASILTGRNYSRIKLEK